MSQLINRQLDPGSYLVFSRVGTSRTESGRVFAEGTANSYVVEHWVLYSGFESPTTTATLEVEKLSSTSSYSSLSGFFSDMETRSGTSTPLYVKATCEYFTELPG